MKNKGSVIKHHKCLLGPKSFSEPEMNSPKQIVDTICARNINSVKIKKFI